MIAALDHIKLTVGDLKAATAATERLLARPPIGAAFQLDNAAFHLSSGETEGLAGLAFEVVDMNIAFRTCERLAPHRREGSIDLALEATFGTPITLIDRPEKPTIAQAVSEGAVTGLDHIVIRTTHPNRAAALYGARLGLDMRLDRTEPKWGARLMFFRVGDLIVEVVHNLADEPSDTPDKLWGLSWRVANIEAAHARLKSSNFDVSELRPGRKPGTRVFTVRNNTLSVPTLIVAPA
jgi:catechol 2,3-dioxygenase-like lactoylglutathione lyase family enzyme